MKQFLFIFVLLAGIGASLLVGCDDEIDSRTVRPERLQFHAGEPVLFTNPFYNHCMGVVSRYRDTYMSNKKPTYKVLLVCQGFGPYYREEDFAEDEMFEKLTE